LDILLADPEALLESLENIFNTLEGATLGPSGIVTTFPIPFIRNSLGRSLGAGTDQNLIARGRRKVIPSLQAGLDSFEGEATTVAKLLGLLIELALDKIGILQPGERVAVDCFYYNNDTNARTTVECVSENPKPSSVMWAIPFGQRFVIEMALDFDLDTGDFPLEIEFDGDANSVPTLTIGWSLSLAFGFDESAGFFLYTFPDGSEEFRVYALLSVLDRTLSAKLIFLKGSLTDLDLIVGASIGVNIDKGQALRKTENASDAQYGRMTLGDLKKIRISDLFSIGALAGATVEIGGIEFGKLGFSCMVCLYFPSEMFLFTHVCSSSQVWTRASLAKLFQNGFLN
jgi:hypothetical protein